MPTAAILRLARQLHTTRTLAEVMEHVVEAISQCTRYERAWISLGYKGRKGLQLIGYAIAEKAMLSERLADMDLQADKYLNRAFTATEAYVIEDVREDPNADQDQVEFFGLRTTIVAPMLLSGNRVGTFQVGSFAEHGVMPPTPDEFAFTLQVGSLVSVVVDRIEAEQARRDMLDKAHTAQRLETLGQLAGEIAHDFNNILTCITGNAQLALRNPDVEKSQPMLQEVLAASSRAKGLIRQLLSFSSGQVVVREKIRIDKVIDEISVMLRRLLPESIELRLDLEEALFANADSGQIEQIIMNLVINARDAMPDGGTILVSLRPAELEAGSELLPEGSPPGGYLHIQVKDNGLGMAPEIRDRIFEPFFTTKAQGLGTGLGLSVVSKAVTQHEGFARLESQAGGGTCFHIYLPQADVHGRADTGNDSLALSGNEHILIVDDELPLRVLLERALGEIGYRVSQACNGKEALEVLSREHDIDLIISDIVMPVMGGAALLQALEDQGSDIPVLLTSAYAASAATEMHSHILAKPFEISVLRARVRKLLGSESRASEKAPEQHL